MEIPGFYQAREFFSPDYSRKKPEDLFPDYRTTLHWEPHVLVTAEKSTKVDFYTSDNKGRYLIKIEGITDDGRVVKSIEEIQIE